MNEPADPETVRERRNGNLILLVCFAAVVGAGLWLISALDQHRKIDDCASQGQRNCVPVEVPGR
jgi:hypothetical protein